MEKETLTSKIWKLFHLCISRMEVPEVSIKMLDTKESPLVPAFSLTMDNEMLQGYQRNEIRKNAKLKQKIYK